MKCHPNSKNKCFISIQEGFSGESYEQYLADLKFDISNK